jgi:hypothetical protein
MDMWKRGLPGPARRVVLDWKLATGSNLIIAVAYLGDVICTIRFRSVQLTQEER